jgi:hypothetical protein
MGGEIDVPRMAEAVGDYCVEGDVDAYFAEADSAHHGLPRS